MIKKDYYLIPSLLLFLSYSCVKETYDMNKLSKEMHFSPSMGISAISGSVTFSDIVKSGDTVVFDQDKFVKIILRKDSVINLQVTDFYDLNNMISFSQSYTIGDLSLSPFQGTMGFTLDQISQNFSSSLRNQFVSLNDGSPHPFPPFPTVNLGEKTFSVFSNIQYAVFSSGFLDISITNNLTAPLNDITIRLYNTSDNTPIGSSVTIPAIQPGLTQVGSIDLSGKRVTNSVKGEIIISNSPGNATPVLINLETSNIQAVIRGRNLKIRSGRAILPMQTISTLLNIDTIKLDPGQGIELEKIKITTGNLSYNISSNTRLNASLNITMPDIRRNGTPITEVLNISPVNQLPGNISFDNTTLFLNSDITHPFNKVPMEYSLSVNSNNTIVTFNSTDKVTLDLKLLNPKFDYLKGFFGQQVQTFGPESIDFGDDIFNKITGDFLVCSPSLKLNYSNSFAIPMQVVLNAQGKTVTETVNLGLAPFLISHPDDPASPDITSSFTINKDNSSLPELISMPPREISFSGSAKMNPAGDVNHLRNNYVFGSSRFIGSLEVEVPMEFRMTNLQLTDTVDNFLKDESVNFELLAVKIGARNGFPLGISVKMVLYDSVKKTNLKTVEASDLLKPATVDENGKADKVSATDTTIELNKDFFSSAGKADKIIFRFTLNTSDNGSRDVKIYSDYKVDFNAAVVVKSDINLSDN